MSNDERSSSTALRPESHGSRSVSHALYLLRVLVEHDAVRVADAADMLGVARSTAHRLLSSLCQHGFARQDKPNGPYHPGPQLIDLQRTAPERLDFRLAARPALEHLQVRTRETVSLALLEGSTTRFVDDLEGSHAVRVGSRTGVTFPAHCTAAGKAMLATLSPAELNRRYPHHQLSSCTSASVNTREQLDRELDQVRRNGYALNLAEAEDGICAVAAATPTLVNLPPAAIAIVVPAQRMPDAAVSYALAPAVLEACQGIGSQRAT